MTPDEAKAHEICREVEARMRGMGVVTTAHYDAGVALIAAALREEREACLRLAEGFAAFTGHRGDDPDAYGRTDDYGRGNYNARASIAAAIRARGAKA